MSPSSARWTSEPRRSTNRNKVFECSFSFPGNMLRMRLMTASDVAFAFAASPRLRVESRTCDRTHASRSFDKEGKPERFFNFKRFATTSAYAAQMFEERGSPVFPTRTPVSQPLAPFPLCVPALFCFCGQSMQSSATSTPAPPKSRPTAPPRV